MSVLAPCEGCGQMVPADDAWTVRGLCAACRSRLYGAADRFESPPLFDCPPQPAGQGELFSPDPDDDDA